MKEQPEETATPMWEVDFVTTATGGAAPTWQWTTDSVAPMIQWCPGSQQQVGGQAWMKLDSWSVVAGFVLPSFAKHDHANQ